MTETIYAETSFNVQYIPSDIPDGVFEAGKAWPHSSYAA
jgi:hypothetical protein